MRRVGGPPRRPVTRRSVPAGADRRSTVPHARLEPGPEHRPPCDGRRAVGQRDQPLPAAPGDRERHPPRRRGHGHRIRRRSSTSHSGPTGRSRCPSPTAGAERRRPTPHGGATRPRARRSPTGDISPFYANVSFAKLWRRVTDNSQIPRTGPIDRILSSHFQTGQGEQFAQPVRPPGRQQSRAPARPSTWASSSRTRSTCRRGRPRAAAGA